MRRVALVSVLMWALAGCMVGPNYQRPPVESPQSWRFEEKEARDLANTSWWEDNLDIQNEDVALYFACASNAKVIEIAVGL